MKERLILNRKIMRDTIFKALCSEFKNMEIPLKQIRNISIGLAEDLFQALQKADKESTK